MNINPVLFCFLRFLGKKENSSILVIEDGLFSLPRTELSHVICSREGKVHCEGLACMCAVRTGFPEYYRDDVSTTASR